MEPSGDGPHKPSPSSVPSSLSPLHHRVSVHREDYGQGDGVPSHVLSSRCPSPPARRGGDSPRGFSCEDYSSVTCISGNFGQSGRADLMPFLREYEYPHEVVVKSSSAGDESDDGSRTASPPEGGSGGSSPYESEALRSCVGVVTPPSRHSALCFSPNQGPPLCSRRLLLVETPSPPSSPSPPPSPTPSDSLSQLLLDVSLQRLHTSQRPRFSSRRKRRLSGDVASPSSSTSPTSPPPPPPPPPTPPSIRPLHPTPRAAFADRDCGRRAHAASARHSEETSLETSWTSTLSSLQDVFAAAPDGMASSSSTLCASPPPSTTIPSDASPPPTPLRPSSAFRKSRMDPQRSRGKRWPSQQLSQVPSHSGEEDTLYSDTSLQGLGAGAASQPSPESSGEAFPPPTSFPSSAPRRGQRSPSPAPSWSSWTSSSSATSSVSQVSQSPPPPPGSPPPAHPLPAGAGRNWWWSGPSPPPVSSPTIVPPGPAQPGPPMVPQPQPVPQFLPVLQSLSQPVPQFVAQPLPCPPPPVQQQPPPPALSSAQMPTGGGAVRAWRYTNDGFFISSLPPAPRPMDLELPPITHDVKKDWENLISTVQSRKQYWKNYLAYVVGTNRALLRMSDQIYQQPRIRLQGARPVRAAPSPQCYENPVTPSLSGSQEHHCTKLQPGRRGLEETVCQEQEEKDDPLPEK